MATGSQIVSKARSALGVRYVWGGNSLSGGVDCSGLVQQVFKAYGINVPRVTYDQINVGHKVSQNKLRPGDLVFFDTNRNRSGPDHVGIYMGGGKFIHAPRPGSKVKISSLGDSYYSSRWMGGRRIPGVSASGGSSHSGADVADVAPRLDAHELAETYGMSYSFFKSQPELFKMLKEAVSEQWTGDKFAAQLKNSKWWKKNSASVRQAQLLAKTDPASYKAELAAARAAAKEMAVKTGAILSEKNLGKLAESMIRLKWNEAQIQNFLGQYVNFMGNKTLGGLAGQVEQGIKKQAHDLGVSVTEQSMLNNARYVVRGLTTMEKIGAGMRNQAAGLYPAFTEQIKAGANMSDLAQPYVQILSEELQLPDTDVNVFTPKVRQGLNRVDEKGQPVPMTLDAFQRFVRQDPRWKQTAGARDQSMAVGRQVLTQLGLLR